MAREGKATKLDDGVVGRVVNGLRYAVLGDTSWFGPGKPQEPVAPPETEGRAWDYPTHYNLHSRPRQQEAVSFEDLRTLADSYDLLRLVIETRKDQMVKLNYSIGFRRRPGEKLRRPPDDRCAMLEEFLRRPDRRHGWATWLRMVLEDLFVIDAPTLYVRRDMEGGIYGLEPMDGSLIKVVLGEDGRTPEPPDPAYQQFLKGLPAVDYTTNELVYFPRNPRPHKAYGYSAVEQIVMTVNIALRRQIHQLQLYTEGNVPEAIAGVPETWTPEQISQFQSYWDSILEGDTAQRRHMKFVPGQLSLQFTKDPQLKDEFDEWLARVVCYAFSVPPLPFVREQNRATAQTAKDAALEEGLAPLMNWVKDLIDHVIQDHFGYHDLEFAWSDERDMDPATKSQVDIAEVRLGLKSIDEVRADNGDDPVGMSHAIFGAGPLGVLFIEDINTPEKREAMMQKMQGGPEGIPGDPMAGIPPEVLQAMGIDDPAVFDALASPHQPPPPVDPNDPVVAEAKQVGHVQDSLPMGVGQVGDYPAVTWGLQAPHEPPPHVGANDPAVRQAVGSTGPVPGSPNDPVVSGAVSNPSTPPPQIDPSDPVVMGALRREFQRQAEAERPFDPVVTEALRRQKPMPTKEATDFSLGFNKGVDVDYP